MDLTIQQILDKLEEHKHKVVVYTNALTALQAICRHDWSYEGHSHNDSLYVCKKCNKDKWE